MLRAAVEITGLAASCHEHYRLCAASSGDFGPSSSSCLETGPGFRGESHRPRQGLDMAEQHDVVGQVRDSTVGQTARAEEIRRLQVIRQVTRLGWDAPPGIGFDAEDPPGAPGGLIIRAQPARRRPTAAFSIVGSSSSTAFAAGPSGT